MAALAIFSIFILIVVKVIAGVVTGSIGILADAIHSAIDLIGAVVGLIGIRIAGRPPDLQHSFGHGKAESIAAAFIAGLIFAAAGIITYEAIDRIVSGGTLERITVGIYVTLAAIVVNMSVSWFTLRAARSSQSIALEATARDLFADTLSSLAVLTGLALVWLTGVEALDSVVALLVAGLIARTAYLTLKKALADLMDARLPAREEQAIKSCILKYSSRLVEFQNLRTRKSGSERHIDFQVIMPSTSSVEEAHKICDELEQEIEQALGMAQVTIHIEPCSGDCYSCNIVCNFRHYG